MTNFTLFPGDRVVLAENLIWCTRQLSSKYKIVLPNYQIPEGSIGRIIWKKEERYSDGEVADICGVVFDNFKELGDLICVHSQLGYVLKERR